MASIFTINFPSIDYKENKRLGYRLPTKVILPQYLVSNPFFEDFFDAVDQVYDRYVYPQIDALANVRNMWYSNPYVEQKILDNSLINLSDWSIPANEVVVKQLSTLGLTLGQSAGLFTTENFLSLCRHLGQFWYEKGTDKFMDFVNFCCGTHFQMKNLWTENYSDFYPEGDAHIGTPIWEGGTWYPTTHVEFTTTDLNADPLLISILFSEIANYNLVMYTVAVEIDIGFGGSGEGGQDISGIPVGIMLQYHEEMFLGKESNADYYKQKIFGYKGQDLHNFDQGSFIYEEPNYEDDEVFGFDGSDQGSFNNPFAR